ncbi:O-antigen ligase [Nitrosomonas sp. Nm166]|uniref:O-antigen ligase family protein n=1 Tax=Nitrosomonas sp. Nm166 TaxID=1881054 RepID=UPI0008EDEDF6|nr:O-antigen ligase family protein [Nitrosomonas sp. Nm166]SFE72951.1 O-antigen ligase [Nitrosomonas sp. Nm166]
MQAHFKWQELLVRFALVLICLGFWHSGWNLFSFPLLAIAWLMDGGLRRLNQMVKEPFVQAILLLSTLLLLGLLWGEPPEDGRMKWLKYYILLLFIPLYSLLNKERLPWATGALLTSYFSVLVIGIYYWLVRGDQGIPLLGMSYLSFSAMLGIGVVVATSLACLSQARKLQIVLWIVALALLFVQFHQNGRIFLIATLITALFLVFLCFQLELRKFIGILLLMFSITAIFAYSSPAFQDRWAQVKSDIELLQQGDYSSSLGYRLAMWDVGLYGIAERPLLGHGTGTPERYFESVILTYKNGIYKNLPQFQETSHYHNDWIEIGMHIGILGMITLLFLLLSWYQIFKKNQLGILGMGLVSYIFLAGLTETFIIFSRTQVLLLIITAIAISWQKRTRR